MRHFSYTIFLFFFFFLQLLSAFSQDKKTTPATVVDIFSDLPINDPASNSHLAPGETAADKIRKNIFVSALLNKNKCYIGEPVLLTFELLSALNSTSTIERLPPLDGFLIIHMDPDNSFPKTKQLNGHTFSVFTIKLLQLIPTRAGNIEITPISVNNDVTDKNDSKNYNYSGPASSKPVSLKVMPLPQPGKPLHFTGVIGDFNIKSYVKLDSFPAGENNKLQIEISGSGNFFSLSLPPILWPAGFQNFELSEKSETDEKVFPVKGKRIFSIPFIANQPGNFTIPAIELDFFDPSANRYRKSLTDAIQVMVLPAIVKPGGGLDKKPIVQKLAGNYLWLYVIAGSLFLFAVIIYVAFIINRRRHNKKVDLIEEAIRLGKEKALIDEKANRFNIAIANLETLELNKNYIAEFKHVLINYLHEKLGMPGAWPGELIQYLKEVDGPTGVNLEQLIEECDLLLYADIFPDPAAREKLLSELDIIVKKINKIA